MAITPNSALRGILLGMTILAGPGMFGQDSPFDPVLSREAAGIIEQAECQTDRSLYITGEEIRFRTMIHHAGWRDHAPWSTVLYVELVSAGGEQLARGKYPVRDQVSSGEIGIPSRLLTGVYYLRCYTRWMRNSGPETFSYVPLRIINPQRADQFSMPPATHPERTLSSRVPGNAVLKFEAHPASFERGDSITMVLLAPMTDHQEPARGCLTVVPQGARPSGYSWEVDSGAKEPGGGPEGLFRLSFLPDRYGPSLSGSVVIPGRISDPLPEVWIHFTLAGKSSGYFVCRSDASGRFTMALPARQGDLELFVQPQSPGALPVEVRIDQDFDPRHLTLPAAPFELSAEERRLATIMARNVQLSEIYQPDEPDMAGDPAPEPIPFYGTPTRSVDMDNYILLPRLDEVFQNLIPGVSPVTRRNETSLAIQSENPALSLFDPLLMIDQVPVFDMDRLMSVHPEKIRRIDVIEDVYVKGDMRFGGLINLTSREKDMAGIDLPANSFFINYLAMHPAAQLLHPAAPEDRVPDTRNTMVWLPDLQVESGIPAKISFTAPDYPGEYVVIFRGEGPEGERTMAETSFVVF